MLRRMLIIGSLAVLAVAHAGLASATQLFARTRVFGEGPLTSVQPSDQQQNTTISTPIALTSSVAGASALASASFGVLRVQSDAVGIAGGYQPRATSEASWEDRLTIVPSDGALLGTTGTLTISLSVDGTFSVSPFIPGGPEPANANASVGLAAAVNGGSPVSFDYNVNCSSSGGPTCTPVLNQRAKIFVFGTPFILDVSAAAGAQAAGSSSASSDYAHTIRWGGFDSILNAQNQPISGFSVLSDSGFDYAVIPEPATAALVMMGMLTLATRRCSK